MRRAARSIRRRQALTCGKDNPAQLAERKSGRRSVCLGIGSAAVLAAVPGLAQPSRTVRIGILSTGAAVTTPTHTAFLRRMGELGYVESRNVNYERRLADGRYERFPEFARDLVARRVDVIVAGGTPTIPAAMAATRTIPIVMATSTDPVANGFVASLARPGGNITGLSNIPPTWLASIRSCLPTSCRNSRASLSSWIRESFHTR